MIGSIAVFSEVIDGIVLILSYNELWHFAVREEHRFLNWIVKTGNFIYEAT